ncbi:MAG TPA: hypothetical protein VHL77_05715 [Ferruginibacter sp.]|nr:hypothetical protein [Ferruginibacter sp.]
MKTIISKALALLAVAAGLLSFSSSGPQGHAGGEGFEILINGKTVLQQYGGDMNKVNVLQLEKTSPTDKITFRYYHCGRVSKNRTVTIKDGNDNTLKVFRFTDVPAPVADMSCSMQDLMTLQKNSHTSLKIYYSSSALPKGRQLVSVVFGNNNKAMP